jgi:hypothetical protein
MNHKKEAHTEIIKLLEKEYNNCISDIRDNKFTFKRLVQEQTILKRKKAELTNIINSLKYSK